MPVFKRWNGKKITEDHPEFQNVNWVCQGMINGLRYYDTFPKELIKTRKQAELEEERIRISYLSGDIVYLLDKTKLYDFIENVYLPHAQSFNTNYKVKVIETNHIKEFFPNLEIKQINVAWVQRFQNHLKTKIKPCQKCKFKIEHHCEPKKLSPSTVNKITRTLSAVLKHAVDNNKLKENPVRKVKELSEPEPLEEFLTAEQKDAMFRELEPYPQLRNLVLLALLTGWRQGQILALKASDLDFNRQMVAVIGSKNQKAKKRPVSEITWQLLTNLSASTPCDWLFFNSETKTRIHKLPKQWNVVREKANLGKFRFHSLRRTSATDMRALSVDMLTIQQVLGHERLSTTQHYSILQNDAIKDALDNVSQEYEKYLQ